MDLFKAQLDRVKQQLAGLTPSQKMLSASLVAIMVMTLWWWARYAGQPEMVVILDQPMSKEDVGRIDQELESKGIKHTVGADGKVMVPQDLKNKALAALAFSNVLPKPSANSFDDTIKKLTAWDGQSRENAVFNRGRELAVEQVIAEFPGVTSAKVFIDPQFKRVIGKNQDPTANVTLTTRDNGGDVKRLAAAAAHIVSGAQGGITASKVKVVINGRVVPVADPAAGPDAVMTPDTITEAKQNFENNLTAKLEKHFDTIPGVRVLVTVRLNAAIKSTREEEYDKAKSLIELQQQTTKSADEQNAANAPLEVGTVPNVGTADAAAANPGRSRNESVESITNQILAGKKITEIRTPAGDAVYVGVSMRVPRSHFVLTAKNMDAAGKEPDAATIEKATAEEIARIRKSVMVSAEIRSTDGVTVEPYADVIPLAGEAQPAVASASPVSLLLGGHVKEIALGALALVSLFMMSMIVRKGTPAPAVAAAAVATPAPQHAAAAAALFAEAHAGEATDAAASLEGVELDDDAIRAQNMLAQVTDLVGENPDAAATLIKRWMNQR